MAISNDQLLSFIKKNPVGVGCGVLCIALGALIYFRGDKIPDAQKALEEKTTEANRLKGNKDNLKDLKEQYDELANANKDIEKRLIKVSENLANQRYFVELADSAKVKLDSATQATKTAGVKAATKGSFVYVSFNLALSGNYSQVLEYLRLLESGQQHFCRILSATVSKPGGEIADLVTLNVTLELLGQP